MNSSLISQTLRLTMTMHQPSRPPLEPASRSSLKEADAGTHLPVGQYALPVSPDFPALDALRVTSVWVAATPQGYWVCLSQQCEHWGMVVW